MSGSGFIHALVESGSVFAINRGATVECFVGDVAFLLGHPILLSDLL